VIDVGDLLTFVYAYSLASGTKTRHVRRRPKQRRARETVEAVLDAVIRILKRDGYRAITTNRIAEVAGVSIGSVYQYFPDKASIFNALHQRHVDQIDRMVQSKLVEHASSLLEDLMRAMIEAMVDAHATDPELYELLLTEVPHKADGTKEFAVRLHGAFRLAISSRAHELKKRRDLDTVVFIVVNMVEALSHGAVLRRPPALSLEDAK
jgi:AcrR family transcriptional regulator